jgi:hypothetical protein
MLQVGTPIKYDTGASTKVIIERGRTGMFGNCHVNGHINAVMTSPTIARFATSAEWTKILHSVKTAANSAVRPSAPSNLQTEVTDAP